MYLIYGLLEPILILRLDSDYDLTAQEEGYLFGIEPLCYMISTFMAPWVVP